jgi:DNA polymerase-1
MGHTLIIDAYNMIHRCRFSWKGGVDYGEGQIIYNFIKTLRATVDTFRPDKVYFALDGKPEKRLELDENYKGNRTIDSSDPELVSYWENFHLQKRAIISLVKLYLPITTAYHPLYEADDIIYHLIKSGVGDRTTIVSSDTDFIQILNEFPETVALYNPLTKANRDNTDYDYVSWKSMVGDRADNIPGVPRIGKKTAEKILTKKGELDRRLSDSIFKEAYEKSYSLIKLDDMMAVKNEVSFYRPDLDEAAIILFFKEMNFISLLSGQFLEKFFDTFDGLS